MPGSSTTWHNGQGSWRHDVHPQLAAACRLNWGYERGVLRPDVPVAAYTCMAWADRCFWSIMDTWRSVTTLPTDVKELIPEFYSTDSSFLVNVEDIDFGARSSGVAFLLVRLAKCVSCVHQALTPQ